MTQFHRFFFIFSLMTFLPFVFLLGITAYPLFLGIKSALRLCIKPNEPPRPSAPSKPKKPHEPNIGADSTAWTTYRKDMEVYREQKKVWKDQLNEYKKNEHGLLDKYYEKKKIYNAKYNNQDDTFCELMWDAVSYMLFFYKEESKLMIWLVQNHLSADSDK